MVVSILLLLQSMQFRLLRSMIFAPSCLTMNIMRICVSPLVKAQACLLPLSMQHLDVPTLPMMLHHPNHHSYHFPHPNSRNTINQTHRHPTLHLNTNLTPHHPHTIHLHLYTHSHLITLTPTIRHHPHIISHHTLHHNKPLNPVLLKIDRSKGSKTRPVALKGDVANVTVSPPLGRRVFSVKFARKRDTPLVIVGGAMVMTMMMMTRHVRIKQRME